MAAPPQSLLSLIRPYLLALDWIIALSWTLRTIQWLRGLSLVPDLRRETNVNSSRQPKLSVIVPACNEEAAIGACLRSLLASTGIALELLAVDDRSTDATGRIMVQVAGEPLSAAPSSGGHSMRVLSIKELPDGWMGKTHAMAFAAAQATGDWLLFTDGDVIFAPDTLSRALSFAEREAVDHLVLYPTLRFESFGERMMLSFLHAISIWGPRPWKVGDPQARRDFIGIGAFNMIRRPVYDKVGGWGALRLEVLEDLRMGFTIKRAGFHQRAVFGRDLIRVRWAKGALGIVKNMTKNLFALFRFRFFLASLASGAVFLQCLLPFVCLPLGVAAWFPCALLLLVLSMLYARFHRLGLPNAAYALTFPVGAALFVFALARSIASTLQQQGVTWRGTFYPLAALRKFAGPLR